MTYEQVKHNLKNAYYAYTGYTHNMFADYERLYAKDKAFRPRVDEILSQVKDYLNSFRFELQTNDVWTEAKLSDIFIGRVYSDSDRSSYYMFRAEIKNDYKRKTYDLSTLFKIVEKKYGSKIVRAEKR